CFLDDQRVPDLARDWGTTRSAAALSLWADRLGGAVVAIGNAPTALFCLLEMLHGRPATGGDHRGAGRIRRRRGIQGRTRRAPSPGAVPDRPRPPRRLGDGGGGDQRTGTGGRVTARLYGVGLGPGDPELITGEAARLIEDYVMVAYLSGTQGR